MSGGDGDPHRDRRGTQTTDTPRRDETRAYPWGQIGPISRRGLHNEKKGRTMTETIQEYTGRLVVLRCWCGIQHAVPESLRRAQIKCHDENRDPLYIICPLGHKHQPGGVSQADRLRQELASEQSQHDQTRAELRDTEARRRAQKSATTRITRRVSVGTCPCCHRTFKQLAQHMKNKHPNFGNVKTC